MLKNARPLIGLILLSTLLLTACTPSPVALLEAIVASAEIAIPFIPGLSPADAKAVTVYLQGAMAITADLLANGTSPEGIQRAVTDFHNLILPELSAQVPPRAVSLISGVVSAISNFLTAYAGIPPASPRLSARRMAPLSGADQVKLAALQARVDAAQTALGPQ